MKRILIAVFMTAACGFGQDATTLATQQSQMASQLAIQQAQMANQLAIRDAQMASQQATQNAQNASQNAEMHGPYVMMTRAPSFSAESGRVTAGTRVRITSPTHYATIFYTTDGWTPTEFSQRYTGPITVDRDMVVQAIAVGPNMVHSLVARAAYTVPGSKPEETGNVATDGVLKAGTRLRLVTAAEADSKTSQVGDTLALKLDQDVMAGDKVAIAKGTVVEAKITHADPPGHAGVPGDIVFEVSAMVASGVTIPLRGGETMEAPVHLKRTIGLMMIPVVGPATLLAHGDGAVIKPGMALTVTVDKDTPLEPTAQRQARPKSARQDGLFTADPE
jgi:hypothetical protein